MTKVQWFNATIPFGIRTLAAKLSELPITIDGPLGFRMERVRPSSLEATYFERFTWTEHTSDPFGRESVLERTAYKSLRFKVSKDYPQLELEGAPRGLKSFFSRLAEITDFQTAIKPLQVDVAAWSAAIQNSIAGTASRVSGITVSDLIVQDGISGQLTVGSREHDVEAALRQLLTRRSYTIQKVQLTLKRHQTASLVLASNGTARSTVELESDLLDTIRTSLPQGK